MSFDSSSPLRTAMRCASHATAPIDTGNMAVWVLTKEMKHWFELLPLDSKVTGLFLGINAKLLRS